jgi:hypothetical protein
MDDRDKISELRNSFDQRFQSMAETRTNFLPHWQELAQVINPREARIGAVVEQSPGNRINQNILDPTATLAVRSLKSGIMAGKTSPSRPWFRFVPEDTELAKNGAVKNWCYLVESLMREAFGKSNLYMVLPMVYGDMAVPGTAAMRAEEDERQLFRFYPEQIGTYMTALDPYLRCDTFYREFAMTARQVERKFGKENVSETIKSYLGSNQAETQVIIKSVVEYNDDRKPEMRDAKNKKYRSCYYESGQNSGQMLRMSGYDEFPVMIPRWDIFNAQDPYGYSPAMDALGLIKGLQKEHRDKYKAIGKYVSPSMVADASLRQAVISLIPDGITYIDGLAGQRQASLRRLEQDLPNIEHLMGDIQDIRQLIDKTFFKDMMQMLAQSDNPEMTAREIEERHSEKVLVLGPVFSRMDDELFDPLIDRSFNIMLRRGAIPKPPEQLQGKSLKIEYTSIMDQALKLMGIGNVEKSVSFVGSMAQLDPKALDKLDVDEAIDDYTEKMGINPRIIRGADQVKGLREIRAKQQQMAQMAQMAKPAEQAAKAGKAMGETDPEQVQQIVKMMTGQAG